MYHARGSRTTGAVMLFAVAALLATLLPAVLGAAENVPKNTEEGPSPRYGAREFTFPHPCSVFVRRTEDGDWEHVAGDYPGWSDGIISMKYGEWELAGKTGELFSGSLLSKAQIPPCYVWIVNIERLAPSWTWRRLAWELKRAEVPGLAFFHRPGPTDYTLAHLKGLTQLQTLNLADCRRITDAGLAHLSGLTQLRELDLSWLDKITDAGLAHLKGLTKLRELSLSHCYNITDAGLVHLKGLSQLRELNLSDCDNITDAGLAHLQTYA